MNLSDTTAALAAQMAAADGEQSLPIVKNRAELLGSGDVRLRAIALDIAEAAIAAADPALAARKAMSFDGRHLHIGDRSHDLSGDRRLFVIGAGKATMPIARVIDDLVGPRIYRGLVVAKRGEVASLRFIETLLADHPVPTAASAEAARRTIAALAGVRAGDLVLACFTGGSSALFVEPADGISLEDKAETNRLLLTCGANILEINAVRKHMSRVKGGRLARDLPAGATLVNLTVSDVIGEPLDYITCPTVPDTASFADAERTLDTYYLWNRLPRSVTQHIQARPESGRTAVEADLAHLDRQDVMLVKTDAACVAAAAAADAAGFQPIILSTLFEGESSALGRSFAAIAREVLLKGRPIDRPCVLIGGGETTVALNDDVEGLGGPNQEFAVAAALELVGVEDVVVLGIDTDGTDGPTPYAGAVADGTTLRTARALGVDLLGALRDHNVTPALLACGHAIETGNTGTNVNDLKLVLIAGATDPRP